VNQNFPLNSEFQKLLTNQNNLLDNKGLVKVASQMNNFDYKPNKFFRNRVRYNYNKK